MMRCLSRRRAFVLLFSSFLMLLLWIGYQRTHISGKREFVRGMARDAWRQYYQDALGFDYLAPISRKGVNHASVSLHYTLIDSLSTLHLLDLHDEFQQATALVANDSFFLSFTMTGSINIFETIIRSLGGLISAYDLSGLAIFKKRAVYLADLLLPAFDTPHKLPLAYMDLEDPSRRDPHENNTNLAMVGSNILEFSRLSEITGDVKYRETAEACLRAIRQIPSKINGLYPAFISVDRGNGTESVYTVGALSDSFYEYLLKASFMPQSDSVPLEMWIQARASILEHLVHRDPRSRVFVSARHGTADRFEKTMSHLACFVGGLFVLDSIRPDTSITQRDRDASLVFAEELTSTCVHMYTDQVMGLAPEVVLMGPHGRLVPETGSEGYGQRPEVVESLFYLWRRTGKTKYREQAWSIAQAIHRHSRCSDRGGFCVLKSVHAPSSFADMQDSYFIAETLKYLYLIYADDVLPLEKWVLNTEAHPLKIS